MTDRTGFYITRALIGAGESGFIPGAVLFTSYVWPPCCCYRALPRLHSSDRHVSLSRYFYTSREMSIRLSFFWSTLNVARVLSALLAAGILKMRGEHGRPGWFWCVPPPPSLLPHLSPYHFLSLTIINLVVRSQAVYH